MAAGACAVFIPSELAHGISCTSADSKDTRRQVRLIWHCRSRPMRGVPLTALSSAIRSLPVYADEVDATLLMVRRHLIHLAAIAIHPEAVARPIEGVRQGRQPHAPGVNGQAGKGGQQDGQAEPGQDAPAGQGRSSECRYGRQSTLTCLAEHRLGSLSSHTHQHALLFSGEKACCL